VTDHVFWIASRAAGVVALLGSSGSASLGLLMAARLVRGRDLRVWHEALGLATMVAIAVHAGVLLFDAYVSASAADVLVPFVGSYQPLWTSLGIVCGWATLVLGLTFYTRARIGVARWRALHRWTALVWVGSLVHAIGEGTDSGQAWFLVATGLVALPAAALLTRRHLVTT
jgi:sulfoxide reductase heme-binding subunit YedZ